MNPVRNNGTEFHFMRLLTKNYMKISNGMKIEKIIFFTILLSLCVLPFLSFAQVGVKSQILPNTGGDTVGIPVEVAPNTGGDTVGVRANFSSNVLSCTLGDRPTLGVLFKYIACTLSRFIIPLLFSLAITMFVWGIVQYVINTDNEEKKGKGKMLMIWGIVALTVMVSVWGLVRILGNTFGVDTKFIPQLNTKKNNSNSTSPTQTTPFFTPTDNTNNGILPDVIIPTDNGSINSSPSA